MGRELLGVPRRKTYYVPVADSGSEAGANVDPSVPQERAMVEVVDGEVVDDGVVGEEDDGQKPSEETPKERPRLVKKEEEEIDPSYVDNVKNAIPIEVVTAWAAIDGVFAIRPQQVSPGVYWLLFGIFFFATAAHMWADVESPTAKRAKELYDRLHGDSPTSVADGGSVPEDGKTRRIRRLRKYLEYSELVQILLAVGAFVVWAYYLGGPFGMVPETFPFAGDDGWYNHSYASILLPLFVAIGPQLAPSILRKHFDVEEDADDNDVGGNDDGAKAVGNGARDATDARKTGESDN